MKKARETNKTCPSLGLADDAHTSLGFPSNWNYCHRSQPSAVPRFSHQEKFCLGGREAYGECPVFLNQQTAPLPKELQNPDGTEAAVNNNSRRNIVIALVVMIALLAGGWGVARLKLSTPIIGQTAPAVPSLIAPTSMDIIPATISVSSVSTVTPASTMMATSDVVPTSIASKNKLEAPIGTDYKFVIHKILEGETMEQFAAQYNTSVDAIVAVNYTERTPGWSGTLLVIPIGFTDFAALPSFIVYQVQEKDRGATVETMAKYLRVTPQELKYYNGWTSVGDRPLVGDYLLVPRNKLIQ